MAPPSAIPRFWIFMYRVSPFTYLIGAILSAGVGHTAVKCTELELLVFNPSPGANCSDYLAPYMGYVGGAVYNPGATAACEFCPLASTDAFLNSVGISFEDRWRNFGLVWTYILFNVLATVGLYWLARVPGRSAVAGTKGIMEPLMRWVKSRA